METKTVKTLKNILQQTPKYLNEDFEIDVQDYMDNNEVTYIEVNHDFVEIQTEEDYQQFYYNEYVSIQMLAEKLGLNYIETTTGTSGYPINIKPAMVGFETFKQAKEIADEYGLAIESFEKRDGWSLWVRKNDAMYEPYKISSQDYGDNYYELDKMDEEDYYLQEVEPYLQNFDNLTDLQNFLKDRQEIFEEIENMGDEEKVIICGGVLIETIKKETLNWSHDTRNYIIGLI